MILELIIERGSIVCKSKQLCDCADHFSLFMGPCIMNEIE